jgi:uncharacterized membrane protein
VHASVLSLYDNLRLKGPKIAGKESSWNEVHTKVKASLSEAKANGGAVVVLTNTMSSPSTDKLIGDLTAKYTNVKQLKWYIAILCVIPMALDGGIQTVAEVLTAGKNVVQFYESNNLFRMITGTVFGYGVGLWMWPMLKEGATFVKKEINIKINTAYLVGILLIANLFIYVGMIAVWDITSPTIKPTNIFDSTAKPRATNIGRCLRAEDSTNPKRIPVPGCEID